MPPPSPVRRRASSTPSSSTSESPVGFPMRAEEAEAHRAADQDRVRDIEEALDHADLVAHLGAPEDHDERVLRIHQQGRQDGHLALQQQPARPPGAAAARRPRWWHARGARRRTRRSRTGRRAARARRPAPGRCVVSPGSKRLFSSTSTSPCAELARHVLDLRPDDRRRLDARASRSALRAAASPGAIDNRGSRPSGRPRCETRTSFASWSRSSPERRQRRTDARVVCDGALLAVTFERDVEVDPHERTRGPRP